LQEHRHCLFQRKFRERLVDADALHVCVCVLKIQSVAELEVEEDEVECLVHVACLDFHGCHILRGGAVVRKRQKNSSQIHDNVLVVHFGEIILMVQKAQAGLVGLLRRNEVARPGFGLPRSFYFQRKRYYIQRNWFSHTSLIPTQSILAIEGNRFYDSSLVTPAHRQLGLTDVNMPTVHGRDLFYGYNIRFVHTDELVAGQQFFQLLHGLQ